MTKGIIYYTDNQVNLKLAHEVQRRLRDIGLPITSCSLKPMDNMGENIHLEAERGVMTMFQQILLCLETSKEDVVFFCEADVLYDRSHFEFTPEDRQMFYYNNNWWSVGRADKAVTWDANRVSQLCCFRDYALDYYRKRIQEIEENGFNRSYEPGGRDETKYRRWTSKVANIDVLHGNNLTSRKWSPKDFRDKSTGQNFQETTIYDIEGWSNLDKLVLQ